VRIHGFGQPPVLEQVPPPQRAAGRSIVRMQAATVGHIDRTVAGGAFFHHPPLPYVPGVEAAGVVVESDSFAPGARVWLRGAGLGTRSDGTWRELIDAPDDALGLLPDAVTMALGSAFFSPCTSAWVSLHEIARLRAGERVLVTGASGAVGSIAVQLALEAGAQVSAAVSDPAQALELPAGVDAVVVMREGGNPPTQIEVDVLVDTIGGAPLAAMLPAVAPGGRVVLVGYTAGTQIMLDLPQFLQRDVSLLPLNMFRREAAGRAAVPGLLARLGDGRLKLAVREFALADAAQAVAWIAQRGHRGRAVLVP
jgi:NADPH2:quinone reductase